jgi:putative Flp pilus-assembly TadE/G-like protein
MSRRNGVRSNERGSVLVMTALWLPVVILMASFVIDAANWFEHKRHLQLQADAGAFAAGSLFNGCFGDAAAANTAINSEVRKYAGDPTGVAPFNLQIGGTNQGAITVRLNKKMFQVGGPGPDDTIEDLPCTAKMMDVKITEAGLPWFLGGGLVSAINARARVAIQQKGSSSDSLPVGVPDNNPVAASAIFIDESNANTVLATEDLTKGTTATLNGQSLTRWTGLPVSLSLTHPNIGVVIALAGKAGWTPPSGSLTAICNNVLIECYSVTQDASGAVTAATGIDFIHGYATGGTGTAAAPIVRDTTLYNVGCIDDSGPYFLLRAACTVGVKAKIDFGTAAGVNPSLAPTLAQVKVPGWGCPNSGPSPKGCKMVYNTTGVNAGYWTTDGSNGYPLMPQDGLGHAIDLNWGTGTGGGSQNGTLPSVQRSFSADIDTSGPVQYIRVDDAAPFANSLSFGLPAHSLSVTIGVKPSLQANQDSPTAPAVALKVVGGSSTQAIDCDPSKPNLRDELATGCSPHYTINKGTACKAASYYVFPQSVDWDCTRTQPGGAVGQVSDGMLCRTQGVCYSGSVTCKNAIHWVDSNGDGKITIPQDIALSDPRIVSVFVTPFGAFSGSGTNVVPITNFASFYVTGFSKNGGGQGDPCPLADPVPSKTGGWIVGHFIKYVDTIGGGGSGDTCDFSSFGSCVAVLTK